MTHDPRYVESVPTPEGCPACGGLHYDDGHAIGSHESSGAIVGYVCLAIGTLLVALAAWAVFS